MALGSERAAGACGPLRGTATLDFGGQQA